MNRVIAYIDGFSLYHGIKEAGWTQYLWLNLKSLCEKFLLDYQDLITVKYFTSEMESPKDRHIRQLTYLDALHTIPMVKFYYGKYQVNVKVCWGCSRPMKLPVEKKTDVQLGIEILYDAYQNNYDTAFLVSGDKDLVPAIEKIRMEYPRKYIAVIRPPQRPNTDLSNVANNTLHIRKAHLRDSLLDNPIVDVNGTEMNCPTQWMT